MPKPPNSTPAPTEATLDPRLDLRALLAVLLGVATATLDTSIANTALPAFAAALHAAPAESIWIINSFQLAVVACLLPLAALGDRLGPRRVFLGGVAVFTLASLACALAHTLLQLSLARALQGMGAAGIMSVNVALIRMIFPASKLGRGVGLNALVVGVSYALGPTIASLVLSVAGWPWLFAINVPLGALVIAVALRTLPRTQRLAHEFDRTAALLTALTFACLIFAISSAAQRDLGPHVLLAFAVSLLTGALLLRWQKHHAAPILPMDLLRRPLFALSALTALCSFTTQGLAFVSLPFYFEAVLHRNPVETGFLMTPWAVVVAAAAPIAGRLSDKHHPGLLGGVGLTILCLGMISLALLTPDTSALGIGLRMALCGIGFGLFQSPNLKALMSSAPSERSSGASGVIAMVRLVGQTSGAALVALCLGLGGVQGAAWALRLGALFAALAAATSFARLRAR
jgi:DHA2 family multidrug resistance protein-like MFS transporter